MGKHIPTRTAKGGGIERLCRLCHTWQPEERFYMLSGKGYRDGRCDDCRKKYCREQYRIRFATVNPNAYQKTPDPFEGHIAEPELREFLSHPIIDPRYMQQLWRLQQARAA